MTAFTYGLEFEVEGINCRTAAAALTEAGIPCDRIVDDIHETHDEWKAVPDGSVAGAEVVSPVLDERRLNEARRVASILSEAGARVSRSTGYHIHIGRAAFLDGNGEWRENLGQFILNYYGIHHAIGALVAPSRLSNRYCEILDRETATEEADYIRGGGSRSVRENRYTSLNLESLQRHGTVEVRLHQGTLNGVKAIAWVGLMTALVKATNAGLSLESEALLRPWQPLAGYRRGAASVDDCRMMLELLTVNGFLPASTADWLKYRAGKLNG